MRSLLGEARACTELLIFACSPQVSPLPQAGAEAVEAAIATSWADRVRISYGGDAARLRAATRERRGPSVASSSLAARDAPTAGGNGTVTLGFTRPGGVLETISSPRSCGAAARRPRARC